MRPSALSTNSAKKMSWTSNTDQKEHTEELLRGAAAQAKQVLPRVLQEGHSWSSLITCRKSEISQVSFLLTSVLAHFASAVHWPLTGLSSCIEITQENAIYNFIIRVRSSLSRLDTAFDMFTWNAAIVSFYVMPFIPYILRSALSPWYVLSRPQSG